MPDYKSLIDSETWAFIEKSASFYPPEAVDLTIEEQRHVYDRMCRAFFAGYPEGVVAQTTAFEADGRSVPIRIYSAAEADNAAAVVYFHGGGFVVGGLHSHDDVCAEICGRTGFDVVSVDYRLSPEHRHPAAFDDAMAAFEFAAKTYPHPVVLCGDSAGGSLAASVSHAARGRLNRPMGQVLIYPGLGGEQTSGSYVEHAEAPMLTVRDMRFYREARSGGADVSRDPSFAALNDVDFSGLPPTVIVTAECDPLSTDGATYRNRIVAAGGLAHWREEAGLVHGYLRARHSVVRAGRSFGRIVEAIQALGKSEWPY